MPRSLSKNVAQLERERKGSKRRGSLIWLQQVDAMDFLERLSIANITEATTEQIQFSCPFPDHTRGDESPSARMNNGSLNPALNTRWNCFACKRGGTAIDFLAEYQNISRQQAAKQLRETYASGFVAPRYGSIAREFEERYKRAKERHVPQKATILDKKLLGRFAVDWPHYAENYRDSPDVAYMLDRGFSVEALEDWEIGYDDSSQRLTIPVYDSDGGLLGFKGRAWRENARPKYLVLGDKGKRRRYGFKTYDKSLVVFGLEKWGERDRYVMVEGELDVIALWMMNVPALCCGGSSMSTAQAKLIRQYTDEVVLFFDNDVAGKNGIYGLDKQDGEHKPGILELLEPHMHVRVVGRHRYDASDYLRRGEEPRCRLLIAGAKSSHAL